MKKESLKIRGDATGIDALGSKLSVCVASETLGSWKVILRHILRHMIKIKSFL